MFKMRWTIEIYQALYAATTVLLIVILIFVTYLAIFSFKCPDSSNISVENSTKMMELQQGIKYLTAEIKNLKRQHYPKIKLKVQKLRKIQNKEDQRYLQNEVLRRKIHFDLKELWNYISKRLLGSNGHNNVSDKEIKVVLKEIYLRKGKLLSNMERFQNTDAWHVWRQREANHVSEIVQRRLYQLQNPKNCRDAKKLYCKRITSCNFGCQLHYIVFCMIFAYATDRTLVLMPLPPLRWEHDFLPLLHPISKTCTSIYGDHAELWEGNNTPKVVMLYWKKTEKFTPLSVPQDLGQKVRRFNGDPASWWVGQVVKFILKVRPHIQAIINESVTTINFTAPIVGIHVRRSDKLIEASFHAIEEYMTQVKEYYDQLQLTTPVKARRVYVATDDNYVLEEVRQKYPGYEFFGNQSIVESAAPRLRGRVESMTGTLVDLHLLSLCDYVVGTFSSQMGRLVYEMMQTNRVDASNSFHSLDDIYYFAGQNAHYRTALITHTSGNLTFQVGDLIGVAGNHWNGYGLGINKRTGEQGLFPWYKTADVLVLEPVPYRRP